MVISESCSALVVFLHKDPRLKLRQQCRVFPRNVRVWLVCSTYGQRPRPGLRVSPYLKLITWS